MGISARETTPKGKTMASYDISTEFQTLTDHGLTAEQIITESRIQSNDITLGGDHLTKREDGGWTIARHFDGEARVTNRSAEAKWGTYYAARIAKLEAQTAEVEDATADAESPATPVVPEAVRKARAAARSYGFRGEIYDD